MIRAIIYINTITISSRGQIVLPAKVRAILNSSIISLEVLDGNKIIMVPVRDLGGHLLNTPKKPIYLGKRLEKNHGKINSIKRIQQGSRLRYICDTNFIIRYLVSDNQEMYQISKVILNRTKLGPDILVLEQAVFIEIIFVLSEHYEIPKNNIIEALSELLTYKGISCEKDMMLLALDYYGKNNIHIVDCLILSKAILDESAILSFDKKLIALSANIATSTT